LHRSEAVRYFSGRRLVAELQRRQPHVLFLQMHSRKNHKSSSTICKWEHPRGESDDSECPGCMKLRLDYLLAVPRRIFIKSVARPDESAPSRLIKTTTPVLCPGASIIKVLVPCWPPPCPTSGTPMLSPVPQPSA